LWIIELVGGWCSVVVVVVVVVGKEGASIVCVLALQGVVNHQ
jgi:hypothetical protein